MSGLRRRRLVSGLLAAALLVPATALRADEGRGMVLTRQAQAALAAGDAPGAVKLLEQARIEWPGAPEVAHTLGDAYARQGDYDRALIEYGKGGGGRYAFRSAFNKGVVCSEQAEADLAAAGVPLDPQGLPEEVPAELAGPLAAAIDAALPLLRAARGHFLDALGQQSDASARESIAALNQRIEELEQMRAELEQQQEEQEQQEQQDQEQEQPQDQPQDQQGEQGEQDQEQDQQQPQDEGDPSEPQEPEDEGDEGEQPTPEEQESPEGTPPPGQGQQTFLSPEQLQQLMEQLEQLEEKSQELQRARRAARRQGAEKDW